MKPSEIIPGRPVVIATDRFASEGVPRGWPGRVLPEIFHISHVEFDWYRRNPGFLGVLGWDFSDGNVDTFVAISEEEYARLTAAIDRDESGV